MYFGTSAEATGLAVPYPSVGGAGVSVEVQRYEETNANGEVIAQQIGDDIITQELQWDRIDAAYWLPLLKFFSEAGDVFWCRFFNHRVAEWQVKRFIKSGLQFQPMRVDEKTGIPAYYTDAGFTIRSMGD